jgi:hypothetical protein
MDTERSLVSRVACMCFSRGKISSNSSRQERNLSSSKRHLYCLKPLPVIQNPEPVTELEARLWYPYPQGIFSGFHSRVGAKRPINLRPTIVLDFPIALIFLLVLFREIISLRKPTPEALGANPSAMEIMNPRAACEEETMECCQQLPDRNLIVSAALGEGNRANLLVARGSISDFGTSTRYTELTAGDATSMFISSINNSRHGGHDVHTGGASRTPCLPTSSRKVLRVGVEETKENFCCVQLFGYLILVTLPRY